MSLNMQTSYYLCSDFKSDPIKIFLTFHVYLDIVHIKPVLMQKFVLRNININRLFYAIFMQMQ